MVLKPLIVILGPTATGKTALAIELCRAFSGEIVSADSRQVYRHMDIGTAKPTPEGQSLVRHHLIDVVDPDQEFSLALFRKMATDATGDIRRRDKLPFLVGGTGLYVWSMVEGWQPPEIAPDLSLRKELEVRAQAEGCQTLYRELQAIDPVAAERIDPRNVRRTIRALEVCRMGVPFSQLQKKAPLFRPLIIGLTTERADLYRRIDSRVDAMIEKGLVEETRTLLERGHGFHLPAMSGLGYEQIGSFLRGETDLPAATQQIKFDTHRFVRHQYSWFRLNDERIHWLDIRNDFKEQALRLARDFVEQSQKVYDMEYKD